MVKEQLTSDMIEFGKRLIEKLDDSSFELSSAFWFYIEDSEKWRFIISSPQIKEEGPKNAYKKVQTALKELRIDKKIALKDISVVEENHSLIKLIKTAIGNIHGISEIRFSRNTINGHYIEDALIYRIED